MGTKLIIGTRGSRLALYQADQARRKIQELFPELTLEVKVCHTLGDRRPELDLLKTRDRGIFCGELERALLNREIDMAVHSVKDLPETLEPGLILAAYLEREDPREVLVSRDGRTLNFLPTGARIGTSSIRRLFQLKARRSDLEFFPVRGNVETRIDKVLRGDFEATILALAGIRRLNLEQRITEIFSLDEMLPAPGQGCIGIEIRERDSVLQEILRPVNHKPSSLEVRAERSFLRALGGDCESGVGAYAKLEGERLTLTGLYAGSEKAIQINTISGDQTNPEALGLLLAQKFMK
ncbi:MAG: hydroxymethylbilane synthase [Firmicutes bacterium]|nr:hydroxymethylbilane synthase [Bacillota bacterium]